jgi:dihydrofolate synthase/folylpolyglutamate synthase
VLEVGLGGRLDATTVGRPAVTVLSAIDLDHQQYLGPTLAGIAAEKAAILRSGLALSAAQRPEAAAVVAARAAAAGVPLLVEGRDLHVTVRSRSLAGQRIDCRGPGWALADLPLGLLGVYQPANALLAVAAARALGAGEPAIRDGLARVAWPGRFQVMAGDPTLVLDGAHNPAGARALADSLRAFFPGAPVTLVFGASRDKDVPAMLAALAPGAARLVLARAALPRAAEPEALVRALPAGAPPARTAASVAEALALAGQPPRTPVVCVAGSLYVVGEALRHLAGGADNPCPIEKGAASIRGLFP